MRKDNHSGFKGVSWHKGNKKWYVKIKVDSKPIFIGMFDDPEEAHRAYCKAAVQYHGKFANFGHKEIA